MNDDNEADSEFIPTPKAYLIAAAMQYGLTIEQGEDLWDKLQAGCMRMLRQIDPDAEWCGIAMDGEGGVVCPIQRDDEQFCDP